ncbi:MAG: cytochrome c oxidase subunit I [Bdellovibrionales bacterium]|nr:cytochrome c oxidase subunit I [Bdellovibrionales bacterium]
MGQTAEKHGDNYINHSAGIKSWLLTLDHKRIGLMYFCTTMVFFLVGGIFALMMRMELFSPGMQYMTQDTFNKFFTYHGAIMVFMVIIPLIPAALGNLVLPMQLGAKDVAFPRWNLVSYYIYLGGALLAASTLFIKQVDTGWTFYTPYSIRSSTSATYVLLGAFTMGFSSILTGLNFIVTIHKLRAPGLTWDRLPLFLWALYATSVIQVLATPVLAITLLLLTLERTLGIGIFDPKLGGDPVLFQHFFWFYSHPAVYIMILPAMGVISEIIPAFSRKPIFGYKAIAAATFGIALVSFVVWGHHLFVSGQSELANFVFSLLTMFVAIPTGVKVFSWLGTLYKGSLRFDVPLLYAFGFLFVFTIGGLTGVFLAVVSVDVHLTDTYFVIAHFHYVMVGGTILAFLAGLHYWFPKFTGKMYHDGLAKVACWFVMIGFNVTFFPQFIVGALGMPRRYADYLPQFTEYNRLSTIGSWILGAGLFMVFINIARSLKSGKPAGDNPWGALTLEWQTPSPPPMENFKHDPVVTDGPYEYRGENVHWGMNA